MVEAIVCVAVSIAFSLIVSAWLICSVGLKFLQSFNELNKTLKEKMQLADKEKTQSEDCEESSDICISEYSGGKSVNVSDSFNNNSGSINFKA